jgi:hypothetical protein
MATVKLCLELGANLNAADPSTTRHCTVRHTAATTSS